MRVAVFGAGYVGLVTGACLADLGHDVVVRDIVERKIDALERGEVPIHEPGLGELLETHKHSIDDILKEAPAHEEVGLAEYRKLLDMVAGESILLEEYARDQIAAEEMHLADIRKMMRKPGSIK